MADKGEKKQPGKPTELKTTNVPDIEVTEEGATGGTRDGEKKGVIGTLVDTMKQIAKVKRSKSKSPETRKDKTQMGVESSKEDFKLVAPPSKKGPSNFIRSILAIPSKRGHCGEETENLCEEQIVPQAEVHQAPPEKDQGYSPSSGTETMAGKCVMHQISSSISSAPTDCSSLQDDDDTDIASPDDLNSPDDGKRM